MGNQSAECGNGKYLPEATAGPGAGGTAAQALTVPLASNLPSSPKATPGAAQSCTPGRTRSCSARTGTDRLAACAKTSTVTCRASWLPKTAKRPRALRPGSPRTPCTLAMGKTRCQSLPEGERGFWYKDKVIENCVTLPRSNSYHGNSITGTVSIHRGTPGNVTAVLYTATYITL